MTDSSRIVVSAPMSLTGSWKRTRNWCRNPILFLLLGVPLLAVWWPAIILWYVVFGIFLWPYRLIRRGSRKRKLADARHRELMDAAQLR